MCVNHIPFLVLVWVYEVVNGWVCLPIQELTSSAVRT